MNLSFDKILESKFIIPPVRRVENEKITNKADTISCDAKPTSTNITDAELFIICEKILKFTPTATPDKQVITI